MNDLQHIRSMAEMIIQKVDALDGTKTPEPKVAGPKFKVGDSVYFSYGKTNGVGVVHKHAVHNYRNSYLIHYPVNNVIANQWFNEEMLSYAQPDPKFKIGDRVKTLNHDGVIVAVLNLPGEQQSYEVQVNNKTACIGRYLESSLTLLKAEPKFKVGDKVRHTVVNKTGTVIQITNFEAKPYVVEYSDVGWDSLVAEYELEMLDTGAERVWHRGPPPHIGWWNASRTKNNKSWRWWDGEQWSLSVYDDQSLAVALDCAKYVTFFHVRDQVEWTYYYPENARVPRINPGVKK
jgi:hypothetical protein